MTKLLICNDPHIADQPPLGRIDNYAQSILAKLAEVNEIAQREEVNFTVYTGDIFNQKRANRVTHGLVNQLIGVIHGLLVLGNHDLSSAGVEGVRRQPIWTLVEAGNLSLLDEITTIGDVALVGRHWDSERAGDPTYYALTEEEKEIAALMKYTVLVCHAPMLPPGDQRIYDSFGVDKVDLTGIDVVVSGHIHERLGIHVVKWGKNESAYFANVGSISRLARTQANFIRCPEVLLLDTENPEEPVRAIKLMNVLPIGQIFEGKEGDDTPEINDEMKALVDRLAEGLQLEDRSLPELLAEFGDIAEPVMKLVLQYLEEGGLA